MRQLARLVLVSCRSPFLDDSKVYCPLAHFYLKSYLHAHGPNHDVRIVDDEYETHRMDWLGDADAVGISVMTPQRAEAVAVARAVKKARPEMIVIAGGPHVRHYLRDLEGESAFDYLVPGDGEQALLEILQGRAPGRIVSHTLSRADIARQPRPDRTSENARDVIGRYHYRLNGHRATTMMTARGCPEHCAFCEDALTPVRPASLSSLRAELDDVVSLGYSGVYLIDDLFTMSLKTMAPVCGELQRRALVYRCNAQARYFTRNGDAMARLLADTGCYEIAFGAESGSQTILDSVAKRCTVAQNYETVALAKKHGLIVKAFLLIGLPGETERTLAETEAFVRNSGIDDFQCVVYMPFRGTSIRRAVDAGASIDLHIDPAGSDGEVSGAFGLAGGETSYEVRTAALGSDQLRAFRTYLVRQYRPQSHRARWADDRFFEIADQATTGVTRSTVRDT